MTLLDGKVAIITGAGQGLGRSHALELAGLGASIVVNDLGKDADTGEALADKVVAEIKAAGGDAVAHNQSCSNWDAAKAMVDLAVDTFGRLDILVNNAGILRDRMSFKMSEADWDAVIDVHLKGHFAPTHHAAVYWREQAKAGNPIAGRIINTSSESGLFGNVGQANYAAAKAGIVGLTLVMARELEKLGVTSNAIAPRAFTAMTENLMGPLMAQFEGSDFNPVATENVSSVVAWLASDESAHVNGQTFIVWGDEVQWVSPHLLYNTIKAGERRFEPDELTAATKELFAGRESGVPAFGVQPIN